VVGVLQRVFVEFEWRLNQATRFGLEVKQDGAGV
jgi:hypothetical protein